MRTFHRWVGTIILLFALWFAATGLIVQWIDLRTIATHAPATDPNMVAIRESLDGPSNLAVIQTADYNAAFFPAAYDLGGAMRRVVGAARAELGRGAPFAFVELRVEGDTPVGLIRSGDRVAQFDASTGAALPDVAAHEGGPGGSAHLTAKHLHRLWFLGDDMLWLNALAGLGLLAMIVTGLVVYFRLLKARRRVKRKALFWSAGGRWRAWHRGISLVAAAFLLVVAVTGTLLSLDSFALGLYRAVHPDRLVFGVVPLGMVGDYSSPLDDDRLLPMLTSTVRAYRLYDAATPIKAIRLRTFAGMPQGVVIAGRDGDARQLIFDTGTDRRVGLNEPNYPYTGFPTGWRVHELLKRIHRGDVIGVPGRLMDVFAGLSLAFLSISGLILYLDLWRRRRKAGKKALFWS